MKNRKTWLRRKSKEASEVVERAPRRDFFRMVRDGAAVAVITPVVAKIPDIPAVKDDVDIVYPESIPIRTVDQGAVTATGSYRWISVMPSTRWKV